LIKNAQPFGKKFQKTVGAGGFFLTHTVCWHLAVAREYLLTSVASTVSRRIFIYIRDL